MILLSNGHASHTLDTYLDIDKFLGLQDDFYFLFASNLKRTKDVWNSGGIPINSPWPYLNDNPLLYHTFHKSNDPKIGKFENDRQGLAKYLQLKYGSFNPYKILHLSEYQQDLQDWVTPAIKDWVKSMPFDSIDMVSFFYNDHYCPLKYHRDYNYFPIETGNKPDVPDTVQDLIWFRFDLEREFNLYDLDLAGHILQVHPVKGYSATFNHYNWHGNTEVYDRASLTIKIEGKFVADFKNKIYA